MPPSTRLTGESALEAGADRLRRAFVDRIRPALHEPRERFLSEDYFVFSITAFDRPLPAEELVAAHGHEIARLLRAEAQPLSPKERDEVLRHQLSYLANDLVVPNLEHGSRLRHREQRAARSRSSSTPTRCCCSYAITTIC